MATVLSIRIVSVLQFTSVLCPFPLQRLQHYMVDDEVTHATVKLAGVMPGDLVLEVGPGTGVLTQALLDAGAHVLAIDKVRLSSGGEFIPQMGTHLENKLNAPMRHKKIQLYTFFDKSAFFVVVLVYANHDLLWDFWGKGNILQSFVPEASYSLGTLNEASRQGKCNCTSRASFLLSLFSG